MKDEFARDILDGPRLETRAAAPTMATRPAKCPSCHGRVIDTLAKLITPATCWRCRGCEHTWTVGAAAGRYSAR